MHKQTEMCKSKPWNESNAILVWQHFASAGGADKNRMVTVTTWLLAFSGVILWHLVTKALRGWEIVRPETALMLATVGIVVSILAVVVVKTYAGYANRNWAKADALAELYEWDDLHPEKTGSSDVIINEQLQNAHPRGIIIRSAWDAAEPTNPWTRWPPIFWWFFGLSILSGLAHTIFLGFSMCWL